MTFWPPWPFEASQVLVGDALHVPMPSRFDVCVPGPETCVPRESPRSNLSKPQNLDEFHLN